MSNRRKLGAPAGPAAPASPDILKVGLIIDPDDPIDTTVQMLFRRPTFGDAGAALEDGEPGSMAFMATIAQRTYLRTETIPGEDLLLSWDELAGGVLGSPDALGRVRCRERPSNLHRALEEVAAFSGFPWDGGRRVR